MAVFTGKDSWLWQDADWITGSAAADTITLWAGDDDAFGGNGNDAIDGGYGNDDIQGDAGNDVIHGGFGHDSLDGNAGADTIFGEDGNDEIYGDAWSAAAGDLGDALYGGDGSDRIFGGAGGDTLDGGNGDDYLSVGSGTAAINGDRVFGGAGVDTLAISYDQAATALVFAPASYLVSWTAPGNVVALDIERYEVRGSDYADQIAGWLMNDTLMGGLGTDTLRGFGGGDEIWGGAGTDTIYGGAGNDQIDADRTGYYDWTEPVGPSGHDVVYAGFGHDVVEGGAGQDQIFGEGGDDSVDAEDGNDTVDGAQGHDFLQGGRGADTIYGGAGHDELYSQWWPSHDSGTEKDALYGGAGNDDVWAGVGDVALGGDHAGTTDILTLTFDALPTGTPGAVTGVVYNLTAQGQTLTTLANGTQVQGFEALTFHGSAGVDKVTGAGLADALYGGLGGDALSGVGGNDILDGGDGVDRSDGGIGNDSFFDSDSTPAGWGDQAYGGAGNDIFHDGAGADILDGGADDDDFSLGAFLRPEDFSADSVQGGTGYDRLSYADADLGIVLDLGSQGLNAGAAVGDRIGGVEQIEGSYYDDHMMGDATANWLDGSGSDDVIDGRGGDDVIEGGAGADDLTGGAGADEFVLESDAGQLGTYWPHDRIRDFTAGQDKLDVFWSQFGVDATTFRLQNKTNEIATGAGPAFVFETDTSRLWWDEDGAGVDTDGDGVVDVNAEAILVATLDKVTSLTKADFAFYDL